MRRPDLRALGHRVHRAARRTASIGYHSIVVPLFGRAETEHALDLACRLASDRGARVVLVAPLVVPQELPLDARFDREIADLRADLDRAAAIADSYGLSVSRRIVCTRDRQIGTDIAEVARDHRAELVVVGAPVESRRGFHRPFPPDVLAVLREAPCRVMIVTGPFAAGRRVSPWHDAGGRHTSSNGSSARMRSSPLPTATSARRSTTPSA